MPNKKELEAMDTDDLRKKVTELAKERDKLLAELHGYNDELKNREAVEQAEALLGNMSEAQREAVAHMIAPKGIPRETRVGAPNN